MKTLFQNPYFVLIGLLGVAVSVMAAVSASGTKYNTGASKAYAYDWTSDTITDAGNDTLTIGELQTSKWTGAIHCTGTQLSGTQLVDVRLQGSAFAVPAAADWVQVANDTLNGAAESLRIQAGTLDLLNYRIIMDGTGTQSSTYKCRFLLKKD